MPSPSIRPPWGKILRTLVIITGVVVLCLGNARSAEASHFRYGHLTWRSTGFNTVAFTFTAAFGRNGFDGTGPDGFLAVGDVYQDEIVGDAPIQFGDGADSGSLSFQTIA